MEINESGLVGILERDNQNFRKNLRQTFNGRISDAMPLIKVYISQLRQIYRNTIQQNLPLLKDAVGDVLEGLYQQVGREGREDLFESGLLGY
jgi:hypothetical protein